MDAFDDLMLGYALKKLTDVFEEVLEVSNSSSSDKTTGVMDLRQTKTTQKLPVWLGRLRANTPYQVTHVLIDQMHAARKLNRDERFAAQAALLEALVEEGLAMHVASYSVAVVEKRLKCFVDH
ncbi:hypothetical protein IMF27_17075 [Pseudomonas sp. PCH199]|uniref:hypothetical protein n=1 Tax=Pseudomonas sp. ERMR1:02 TaxID=1805930 RepID=UPI000BCE3A5E|nr:hypothetical protein [Pseudomonas sp. ERMR1:02]MCW8277167.1 hypothetical protein [Pseudomonas sp. PCH199]PAM82720.1 hypothetical protein CES87_17420 [Pseudomonas sp. ERMR1:02]